jgi:hypothetical protein
MDCPATRGQSSLDRADDRVHGYRALGGDVEILAGPVNQTVSLDRVSSGDNQRKVRADLEQIAQQATMQVGEIHSGSYRTKFREGRLPDLADVPADQDAEYRPLAEQEISVQVAANICPLAFGQDNAVKRHARPRTSQIEHCQARPGDVQRKPNNARRRPGQLIERAGKSAAVPRLQHGCSVWQAWSGARGHDPIVADTPDSWHAGQSATSLPDSSGYQQSQFYSI